MSPRDPYAVLGVEPGASQAQIKAAWRRLAREHHPDLSIGDPVRARASTRRMAEINAAYQSILRSVPERRQAPSHRTTAPPNGAAPGRHTGPPPPPRTRPVTGRLDTTDTIRPRNATTGHPVRHTAQAPRAAERSGPDPLRASDPNGPVHRDRDRSFRRRPDPPLDEAAGIVLEFGKFRGHTLGEVAAFEPSYVDWLAKTITRDRDLVAAARVVQADLDARGVARRIRESPPRKSPFAAPGE